MGDAGNSLCNSEVAEGIIQNISNLSDSTIFQWCNCLQIFGLKSLSWLYNPITPISLTPLSKLSDKHGRNGGVTFPFGLELISVLFII